LSVQQRSQKFQGISDHYTLKKVKNRYKQLHQMCSELSAPIPDTRQPIPSSNYPFLFKDDDLHPFQINFLRLLESDHIPNIVLVEVANAAIIADLLLEFRSISRDSIPFSAVFVNPLQPQVIFFEGLSIDEFRG
jgi:hypothetical protein